MTILSKKILQRRSAALVAVALALGSLAGLDAQAQSRAAKSFLWKVQSGPRVMYLAGSVHALSADVYPLNPAFEQAFAASDTLLEEIDLDQSGILALAPMLLSKAMYQDGRTFDKVVSKETVDLVTAQLKGIAAGRGADSADEAVDGHADAERHAGAAGRPRSEAWGWTSTSSTRPQAAGKTVIGLETAESQIDRFDKMPEALQEQLLRSTLEEHQRAEQRAGDHRRGAGGAAMPPRSNAACCGG